MPDNDESLPIVPPLQDQEPVPSPSESVSSGTVLTPSSVKGKSAVSEHRRKQKRRNDDDDVIVKWQKIDEDMDKRWMEREEMKGRR